jgi:cyanophycinase-like exopeptidase
MYLYHWGNNEKRAAMKGRACEVVARQSAKKKVKSVMIEYRNGQRDITSIRALRKAQPCFICGGDGSYSCPEASGTDGSDGWYECENCHGEGYVLIPKKTGGR